MTTSFAPVNIDLIIENSYKDFHAKGFDYLCFHRSPEITQKIYFFDGDISQLPEVVNPHTHRYDFTTWCLSGEVENITYGAPSMIGMGEGTYQVFEYMTPLNGGNGFTHVGEAELAVIDRQTYTPGAMYSMLHDEIHTIRMVKNQTILLLNQLADIVPVDEPTLTYTRDVEPPSLSGLYNQFTRDEVVAKFGILSELVPNFPVPMWA